MHSVTVLMPDGKHRVCRLRWRDEWGKAFYKSTDTVNRKEAERQAVLWQAELERGVEAVPQKIRWEYVRDKYMSDVASGHSDGGSRTTKTAINHIDAILRPQFMTEFTSSRMSTFAAKLRARPVSEASVKTYVVCAFTILGWAKRMGFIAYMPERPPLVRGDVESTARGGPLTEKQFSEYLEAVEAITGSNAAPSWKFWITGLFLSGLRIKESLSLTWTPEGPNAHYLDLSGAHPMFAIRSGGEKGGKTRLLPMTPDFYEHLMQVPKDQRHGKVFMPMPVDKDTKNRGQYRPWGTIGALGAKYLGDQLCAIGFESGVVVARYSDGSPKYASAHDLRRSFGTRWALRVPSLVLKKMMRHASIRTTEKYYVAINANDLAEAIWNTVPTTGCRSQEGSNSGSNRTKRNPRKN